MHVLGHARLDLDQDGVTSAPPKYWPPPWLQDNGSRGEPSSRACAGAIEPAEKKKNEQPRKRVERGVEKNGGHNPGHQRPVAPCEQGSNQDNAREETSGRQESIAGSQERQGRRNLAGERNPRNRRNTE